MRLQFPKITPEQVDEFKARATLDQATADSRERLKQLQDAYQNSLNVFSQAAQFQAPERQQVSPENQLYLAAGDALRDIVSTAPRKFRQERNPSVQTAQGLKDQEYARQLQDAQIAFQNQQQQILARQKAAEVGLQGQQAGYEGALTAEQRAQQNLQTATQSSQFAQQMREGRYEFDARLTFDQNEAKRLAGQFNKSFGLDKEQFEWAKTPEWKKAAGEYKAMIDSGVDPAVAESRAYGKWILQDKEIAKADLDLQTAQRLFSEVLPAQIKDQLAEYEYNKKVRPLNLSLLKKQVANYGRGSAQDPLDPFRARLNSLQGLIDQANANKAAQASKPVGSGSTAGDLGAFDDLIDYYKSEQKRVAEDMNYVAGKTVVDPNLFVPSQRNLRETVGG